MSEDYDGDWDFWEDDSLTCAGCAYWDGDDGRCRNGSSVHYMAEYEDGCEKKEET